MYMYLQPQYCVSYSLNINNFCNFKTGGVLDSLLILCFLQLKYWLKTKKKQVCMTFDSISGPRQRRSPPKIGDGDRNYFGTVLSLAVLVSILLVVLETVSLFF